ncbi:MAG: SPFH domain-containing protein, partial [Ruminococcaceae bacterium]|nr:SPFH domain-containing protein [Oscillospiraceae bacterium]
FTGKLSQSIPAVFANIGKRFGFGGEAPMDQRVYYFNTKELVGNKYGTPSPVPFRVVDRNIGLDVDISIRCFGEYSYRITNPILFYTNVCGNVDYAYNRDNIDGQLKTELLTALQPAFAKISALGIRYSALPGHTMELANALNEVLSAKWAQLRGVEIVSFGVSSVKASEEDEKMIKELQRNAAFRDPNMAAAHLVGAQAAAMQAAAANEGAGPAMAFMGMNMAAAAGGANAQALYKMGQTGWTCRCGAVNQGKFCSECGARKPGGAPMYHCDKCGWQPEDPMNPPKFCPECGDRFDDNDQQ